MLSVWEVSQGINLEAKCIKLVIWLGLLERFPTMRGEPELELSGPIAVVWILRRGNYTAELAGHGFEVFQSYHPLFHLHSSA